MTTDLKLKIKIQDQMMTLWEIIKEADSYIMFRGSIVSGKKNLDGTWDNVSQNFTCFANGEAIQILKKNFSERAKVVIGGSLALLPEKRQAMGKHGQYQETIFSSVSINVETIKFLESTTPESIAQAYTSSANINDSIPF